MTAPSSLMRREVQEIPDAVERLLHAGGGIAAAAAELRALDPALALTVARGSSDHVCTYFKYAAELLAGLPVASIGPSVASIYGAKLRLDRGVCVAVSQSGRSPDIVAMARAARRDSALTLAVTNDPEAPLAESCAHVLDIHAGEERSVAATKTFVTSAVACLLLLAERREDAELRAALHALPEALARAAAIEWPEVQAAIGASGSLFTLGRGPALAVSNEAALKFKETCRLHAESYSSAEVLHGPVSIVEEGFPVLCFVAADAAEAGMREVADQLADKGARVFVASSPASRAARVEHVRTAHALTDPLALIVSFYAMVERVAVARGIDPDVPRHLRKVTETR